MARGAAGRPARARRGRVQRPATGYAAGMRRRWLALAAVLALVAMAAAGQLLGAGRGGGDGGPLATLQTADFHALAFSPDDPNVVFFGHHHGIMRSDDGGRTWSALVQRAGFDAMGMAVSHGNSRQIYLAGHNVFQTSPDGGKSWQPVEHNLPGTDIHAFAMSPDDPARLYAFVVGHGFFQSADGGRQWQPLPNQPPGGIPPLVAAGGSPETLYVGREQGGLLRSSDGGQSWTPIGEQLADRTVFSLALDPTARQILYAGTDDGLHRSMDGGATWSRLPLPGSNVVALTVSPAQPNVVLAIAVKDRQGLVFRSVDGGTSWSGR